MRIINCLLPLLLMTSAAFSQSPEPAPSPVPVVSEDVIIRIVRQNPEPGLVAWLAKNARPSKLTPEGYPSLPSMTADEVIGKLCGQALSGYWKVFIQRNGLEEGLIVRSAALGVKAYEYEWPACFYYESGAFRHTLEEGERPSDVYQRETGDKGTPERHRQFFGFSSLDKLTQATAGQELKYGYRTRPVIVRSLIDRKLFAKRFNDVARSFADMPTLVPPITGGGIITPVDFTESGAILGASGPVECDGRLNAPFDLARLEHAYMKAASDPKPAVTIVVADNGFFGAVRGEDGSIETRKLFERKFFDIKPGQNGQPSLGTTLTLRDGSPVSPLNFENSFPANYVPTEISGHGTHVVGLALGGEARASKKIFGDSPWLRAWLVAFSPGLSSIDDVPASQLLSELDKMSGDLGAASVVNMSLRLSASAEEPLRTIFARHAKTLFVVAAGNHGINMDTNESSIYPAALGGLPNVLTVAAEDGTGYLTQFSNRSMAVVDIAAPGCNVQSTLDGINPAVLSGTSQAAPIATFAAALLDRVHVSPENRKRRLVLSGDLLEGVNIVQSDGVVRHEIVMGKARIPVRSRSRLNIVKALYKDHDYLRYRDEQGQLREVLGQLGTRTGPDCGVDGWSFPKVFAFKRSSSDGQAWCFWRNEMEPSAIQTRPEDVINFFNVLYTISPDGTIQAAPYEEFGLPLDRVDEFVMSETHMDYFD